MTLRILGMFVLIGLAQVVIFGERSIAQVEELAPLKSYEGTWDSEFKLVSTDSDLSIQKFSGVVTGKWVVGDRFLEQTGTYRLGDQSPPLVIKTLMTFDKKQEQYEYVYFISSGEIQRSHGQWDAETKTMTSKMTAVGTDNLTTIVADFSKPGVEQWVIETHDNAGRLLTKLVGTNTRRKNRLP